MTDLYELHERITKEVIDETNREMEQSIADKRAESKAAEMQAEKEMEALKKAGLDLSVLETLDYELSEEAEKEREAIEKQMNEASMAPSSTAMDLDVESAFLPPDAFVLTPSWTGEFSDQEPKEKLTGGVQMAPAQTTISGGSCKNVGNWAKGGGWGCTGGVGSRTDSLIWGFWFKPTSSRFYSVRPYFQFRGYYIVQANDKWYNCKDARVRVTARVRVHQYNWKPWVDVVVNNVGGGNINRNRRFDADRHVYYSALLGGGDWAFIQCRADFYVYAKGGGSYAKNDFSTGAANHVCVPHVHVI